MSPSKYDPLAEALERMHIASDPVANRIINTTTTENSRLVKTPDKPKDILRLARNEVGKALGFLEREGVFLGYIPTIAYQGVEPPSGGGNFAAVKVEADYASNFHRAYGPIAYPRVFSEHYGLQVSPEAVEEVISVFVKESEEDNKAFNIADITFFANTKNHILEVPEATVHELWHLKERAMGFINPDEMVYEGTANYAGKRYVGRRIEDIERVRTLNDLAYRKMGYLVQQEMDGRPLSHLLSEETRATLRAAYKIHVAPYIVDILVKRANNPKSDPTRRMVKDASCFRSFRKKKDAKSLLEAFRARGLIRFSAEMEQQDLSRLVDYHRKLISA